MDVIGIQETGPENGCGAVEWFRGSESEVWEGMEWCE